jgi:uncharacterized protein (TIGR02271 family)
VKAFFGFDLPADDRAFYEEGVRRGGRMVIATTPDDQIDRVEDVMGANNAIDIDQRAQEWRQSGWQGIAEGGGTVIPVAEEELRVGKREVRRGGVRVYQHVTEHPVEEDVTLREETISVERRPANREVTPDDREAFQERTVEMTETAEEAVANKRARIIEEVIVRKDVRERKEKVRDTVRKADVKVERTGSGASRSGESPDQTFQQHFQSRLANRGYTFEQYGPAYRFGEHLAAETPFGSGDWNAVEPEVRRSWEARNAGTWEDFKDAVRYAWERGSRTGQRKVS